jgi:hypothetical protein
MDEYNQGWSEGCKRETDRLLREEIRLLEREVFRLQQLLAQGAPSTYFPATAIAVTAR